MRRQAVDNLELNRWRSMSATSVLASPLCEHAKLDPTFRPIQSQETRRWHVTVGGHVFELLCTGPKFFDTRVKKGGGGAVDLVMHLHGVDFKGAVRLLRQGL
ncbi:MAG: hypothetical protein RI906_1199 [Pseudomonadota bacterium]|jgi:hypothetical protein